MKRMIILLLALGLMHTMTGCKVAKPEVLNIRIYCTSCGEELTSEDKFCRHCGTPTARIPDDIFMFDGDRTYMANDVMLPLMVGTWESDDGRYAMTYDEDGRVAISFDGSPLLDTIGDFTHLEPGGPCYTDLRLECAELKDGAGNVLGKIAALGFDPAEGDGCMVLKLYDGKTAFSTETLLLGRVDASKTAAAAN